MRLAVSTTISAFSAVSARGFSTKTWAPVFIALIAKSACVSGSVLMETTSGLSSASAFSKLSNFLTFLRASGSVRLAMRRSQTPCDLEAWNSAYRRAHGSFPCFRGRRPILALSFQISLIDHDFNRTTLPLRAESSAASVAASAAVASSGRPMSGFLPLRAQSAK